MQFELEYYAEGVRYASVVQLNWNIRRRRSLISAQGLERSDNLGIPIKK